MKIKILKFFDFFDFKKTCGDSRVDLWECPPFLFFVMGVIIIVAIILAYFVGRVYVDPIFLALIVCALAFILLVMSYIIMNSFERIARSSKEKSEFISIVSHQLRNPLSSIKWQIDLLLNNMNLNSDGGKESLLAINEQNQKMIAMVNDLLEINRFESEVMILNKSAFLLASLIKETVAKFFERASASDIDIRFFPPEENIEVVADKEKLAVVVSHLLDNAIRYSPNGGLVELTLEKQVNRARFSVTDEGAGITEYDKPSVFNKFFRGTFSKKYKSDGLGVGLYLVRGVVGAMGGRVGFSSIEGKGSTFWFVLPLKS